MNIIKFTVTDEVLRRIDQDTVVEGSKKYLYASFTFSEVWKDMPKTAVFSYNGSVVREVVIENDECQVPEEVVKPTKFNVTVYSGNTLLTNAYDVGVYTCSQGCIPDPTPSVYEQLVTENYEHELRISTLELGLHPSQGTIYLNCITDKAPEVAMESEFYYNSYDSKLYRYTSNQWLDSDVLLKGTRLYFDKSTKILYAYDKLAKELIEIVGGSTGTPSTGFDVQIVDRLPESGEKGIIYLIKVSTDNTDSYDEYIWLGSRFELIGSTNIDLSQYAKKSELDYYVKQTELKNYVEKNETTNVVDETAPSTSKVTTEKAVADAIMDLRSQVVTITGNENLEGKTISAGLNTITGLSLDKGNFEPSGIADYINTDAPSSTKLTTESAVVRELDELEERAWDELKLTAGENIKITRSNGKNIISGVAELYEAGENINITGNVISAKKLEYISGNKFIRVDGTTISGQNIPEYINALKDVNFTDIKENQTIVYQDGKWVNKAATEAGFYSAEGYVHISDDNVITVDLSSKQDKLTAASNVRIWNYYGTTYIEARMDVNALTDASINNAESGHVLIYDGTQWVNSPLPEGKLYTAGSNITMTEEGDSIEVSLSSSYTNSVNSRLNTLSSTKQNKLIAGENITIESDGTISALADVDPENIPYNNVVDGQPVSNVKEALDAMFYTAPVISNVTSSATLEIGEIITERQISWKINKKPTSQYITLDNQARVDITFISGQYNYSHTYTGLELGKRSGDEITKSHTFRIFMSDGKKSTSSSSSVNFYPRLYAGVSDDTNITEEKIKAADSKLQNSRMWNYTFKPSGKQYPFFAIPVEYCEKNGEDIATFTVGVVNITPESTKMDITNEHGVVMPYKVYYLPNPISEETLIKVS